MAALLLGVPMVDAPILPHYTDAFGVHGIISSNCLWATATQFSNDLSEIECAVSIAIEIIKEMWGSKKNMSPWEKVPAERLVQLFATPLHTSHGSASVAPRIATPDRHGDEHQGAQHIRRRK